MMINFPVKKANGRIGSPLSELEGLQREMDQLFDLTFPGFWKPGGALSQGQWIPALDVIDEENQILIAMDLPGMTKRDITVSVEGRQLTVQGERRRETTGKAERITRAERSCGSFTRCIPLPASADTAKVKAAFRDGVLRIRFPKREEHRPKLIEVQIE